jgi:hypothetical protein
MMDFEKRLSLALSRQDPPSGFEKRVLAAVVRESSKDRWWKRVFVRRWVLLGSTGPALAALMIAAGGAIYQHHEDILRGETAKRQLLTAMRIAGKKLYVTQQRVESISDMGTKVQED